MQVIGFNQELEKTQLLSNLMTPVAADDKIQIDLHLDVQHQHKRIIPSIGNADINSNIKITNRSGGTGGPH